MTRTIVLLLGLLLAPLAHAATVCRVVSGGAMAFGDYDFFAPAPKDSLTTVIVTCDRDAGTSQVTVTMRVDQGTNGTSSSARRMLHTGGSGDTLSYGLYRDVSRSSVWGTSDTVDTMSVALTVPPKGTASANFTIYGRIPVRQDVSAGNYVDSVQITILY